MPLTPLDGGVLLPYDCHEGNLAIRKSLGAERAEDRALAADLAKGHQARAAAGAGRQPRRRRRRACVAVEDVRAARRRHQRAMWTGSSW